MARDLISPRIAALPSSPTIAVAKQAEELRRQGVDVVDFGPGEPDFDTPEAVCRAAIDAMEAGMTHYPPGRGLPELREAIADKLERDNSLHYDPMEIIVTPGAKQAILEAVFVSSRPGDEVVIFDPGWGSYDAIVRLAGATPIHVPLREDFSIDADALRAAVSPRTRSIIVGTPSNPTGHVLDRAELELLAEVCAVHDLLLISDEIYERITYGETPVSPAALPGMRERTVTVNGFSKAYAMTGWRLGYAAAPRDFVDAMLKVHEHSVTAAASFVQVGGIAALRGSQEPIRMMVEEFARRREIVLAGLERLPGITVSPPDGTFYAFPDVSGTGFSGTELAFRLLECGVAVTPGAGFGEGWDTHIRISFATGEDRIRAGLERMGDILST